MLICYNAANVSCWHAEIVASLKATGTVPEELADTITATQVFDNAKANAEGVPCYRIDWA